MRWVAVAMLLLLAGLFGLTALGSLVGVAFSIQRISTEPEDLYASIVLLITTLIVAVTAYLGALRAARSRNGTVSWWEYGLAGLTLCIGAAMVVLSLGSDIDALAFRIAGAAGLLIGSSLLLAGRQRDRAA